MPNPKRLVEVRLLVIVTVNLADSELAEGLNRHRQPSSVAELVGAEVISNLESVSYIETALVSRV